MPSLIDSTPQPAASGDWSSLYAAAPAEPMMKASPRHVLVAPPVAAAKKPAYGGGRRMIKNLETCTEALGCETGGVDVIVAAEDDVVVMATVEADGVAERKRREREEAESVEEAAASRVRRALPPPLTTLTARGGGGSRVRMVQERRDGRLTVYAVRTSGVQAERCGGRLRLRLVPCAGCRSAAECHQKAKQLLIQQEAEEEAMATVVVKEDEHEDADEEEYSGVAKYVRGGRCVDQAEVAAGTAATAAARRGESWEPEHQAARIWVGVATT